MAKQAKESDLVPLTLKTFSALLENRQDLFALALFPFAVKTLTFMIIIFLGLQENILRQGLFFVPSFLVEGWFVASALRLTVYHEHWPFFLTGDTQRDRLLIKNRRKSIQGAGALYTLLRLISVLILSFLMHEGIMMNDPIEQDTLMGDAVQGGMQEAAPDLSGAALFLVFVMAMGLLAGTLWAFRYFCLYVPVALGLSMKEFLKTIWGFKGSVQLIFISIVCFVPPAFVFGIAHGALDSVFPNGTLDAEHWAYSLSFAVLQSMMEVAVSLTTAVALGFFVAKEMKIINLSK